MVGAGTNIPYKEGCIGGWVEAVSPDTYNTLEFLGGIEGWRRHPVERPPLVTWRGLYRIVLWVRESDMPVPDLDILDQMVQAKDVVEL